MIIFQTLLMRVLNRLQEWIGPTLPYFFFTPHERTIGNTAEEIHFALMYARRHERKLILLRRFTFFGYPIISNYEIFDIESPYIASGFAAKALVLFGNTFLTIFFGHIPAVFEYIKTNTLYVFCFSYEKLLFFITKNEKYNQRMRYKHFKFCFFHLEIGLEHIWNPSRYIRKNSDFSWDEVNKVDWQKDMEEPLPIFLRKKTQDECERIFNKLQGPGPSDWYVCFHCREGGFHNDIFDRRNNKQIETYYAAIKEITDAGGWVIRLGDRTMTKLPKMERVIDYPFSEFKSPAMDFYLIQNCKFYFGQNSGVMDIAYLLQKKCVIVNSTEWGISFVREKNSLFLIKHYYSHAKGRYLSIKELLQEPFHSQDLTLFEKNNHFSENTSEELRDIIVECLSQNDGFCFSGLQKEFQERRRQQITAWVTSLEGGSFDKDHNRLLQYRIASRMNSALGSLGKKFLEKNWDYSTYNTQNTIMNTEQAKL